MVGSRSRSEFHDRVPHSPFQNSAPDAPNGRDHDNRIDKEIPGSVHAWLQNVPFALDPVKPNTPESNLDNSETWYPHNLPLSRNSIEDKVASERGRSSWVIQDNYLPTESRHVRKREASSSYSSSLSGSRPRTAEDAVGYRQRRPEGDFSALERETYHRRPRRKTRHDRYDPDRKSHGKSTSKRPSREEPSAKRQRKVEKKRHKQSLRYGKDVMDDFSSPAIQASATRVIMKPNLKAGLFQNGRGSSSITDLKFDAMRFFSQEDATDRSKLPKGQLSKEQRRRELDLLEASEFFHQVPENRQAPKAQVGVVESAARSVSTVRHVSHTTEINLQQQSLNSNQETNIRDLEKPTTPNPRGESSEYPDSSLYGNGKVPDEALVPVSILREIIKSGVLNYTRYLDERALPSSYMVNQAEQAEMPPEGLGRRMVEADANPRRPIQYEDKGVFADLPTPNALQYQLSKDSPRAHEDGLNTGKVQYVDSGSQTYESGVEISPQLDKELDQEVYGEGSVVETGQMQLPPKHRKYIQTGAVLEDAEAPTRMYHLAADATYRCGNPAEYRDNRKLNPRLPPSDTAVPSFDAYSQMNSSTAEYVDMIRKQQAPTPREKRAPIPDPQSHENYLSRAMMAYDSPGPVHQPILYKVLPVDLDRNPTPQVRFHRPDVPVIGSRGEFVRERRDRVDGGYAEQMVDERGYNRLSDNHPTAPNGYQDIIYRDQYSQSRQNGPQLRTAQGFPERQADEVDPETTRAYARNGRDVNKYGYLNREQEWYQI